MPELKDKVAIVTGSTKGIGRAVAEALLAEGTRVVISARSAKEVDAVTGELGARGRTLGVTCDMRDSGQVRKLIETTERELGGLDILVNNAGVGGFKNVADMSDEDWNRTIETNLTGVFYASREAVAAMRRRGGGAIINIGSLAGKQAFPGGAAYCASKFGLVGFSEAFMQEVRYDHIRVAYVMPGSVDTAFGGGASSSDGKSWKLSPLDVAEVVLDLLRQNPRALASRVELRPSEPQRK